MNTRLKPLFLTVLVLAGVSFSGIAQTLDLKDLQEGAADLSKELAKSLPLNSSLGMNWSDAYIGKLFPSLPPHFGVGGTFGFTTMEMPALKKVADDLGYGIPFNWSKMVMPAYTVEARVGGLFLPFDVGFKFGYLPPLTLWGKDTTMNYLLVGADIRYALLDGKSKVLLPSISFSVGINHLKGSLGGKGKNKSFSYNSETITIEDPEVNLEWKTNSLDFKFQISKSILLVTPYVGLGASYAWSSAGYSVDAAVDGDISGIKDYLNACGLEGIDVDRKGISSSVENSAFSARLFGGFSINLMVFKIDFTGLYSIMDGNFGATLGFRVQI